MVRLTYVPEFEESHMPTLAVLVHDWCIYQHTHRVFRPTWLRNLLRLPGLYLLRTLTSMIQLLTTELQGRRSSFPL